MIALALLGANLLAFNSAFAAEKQACSVAVLSESIEATEIDKTIHSLSALRLKLDIAKTEGSNSIAVTALANEFRKKEKAFVAYLEQNDIMAHEQLIDRMKREIGRLQSGLHQEQQRENQDRSEHLEAIRSNPIDGTRAIFHRVEPGSSKMGKITSEVDITLTGFDMMATLTTQIIWKKIAELANAKLGSEIKIDPSHFKGDTRPVEQVSYEQVQEWLEALNALSLLGESSLVDVIPDHKQGDLYGLPTEAQWEFVARGRGQYNDTYLFLNDQSQFEDYAWIKTNSIGQTHPVAQKLPLFIDDSDFYDLYGNVLQWTNDSYDERLTGGRNPQGPDGYFKVMRGLAYNDFGMNARRRFNRSPLTASSYVGFRFIRKVKGVRP
ncbi:MAG TPA: formylglycine-generating enzyme family protein [Bdellovibrionales bacterium]|nr:formylglycine-generating enzyme family protein [Bdellovibrionales bacterium]